MLNNVALQGRLVADPQLRQTTSGKQVASFRLACDRGRKDANGNNITDWIECVAWENTANFISKYFQKGSMIVVSGSIQTRQYEDKSGAKRTATEVLVASANFCESKRQQKPADSNTEDFAPIADDGDLPF